jgi:PE family
MSYVSAVPDPVAVAAIDAAGIGSSLDEANAAATAKTTAVVAAAEDEVSAAVASLFSGHGQAFQALSSRAAGFHAQFVQTLGAAAQAYASAEAAGSHALQSTLSHATAAETLNVSVSVGKTVFRLGDATSSAGPDDIAIAYGAHSSATASAGRFDIAFAVGTNNSASATGGYDNIAAAFGADNKAAVESGNAPNADFNFAGVFGGESNTATAGIGFRNIAAVVSGHDISAKALNGDDIVSIEPKGASLNLAIAADDHTLFRSGSATANADKGDFAVAYGNNSGAIATGVSGYPVRSTASTNVALAIGNNDQAFTVSGHDTFAFAFGTDNKAQALGSGFGFGGYDYAVVLGGTGNTALAAGDQNIALVITGDNLKATAVGFNIIDILPKL